MKSRWSNDCLTQVHCWFIQFLNWKLLWLQRNLFFFIFFILNLHGVLSLNFLSRNLFEGKWSRHWNFGGGLNWFLLDERRLNCLNRINFMQLSMIKNGFLLILFRFCLFFPHWFLLYFLFNGNWLRVHNRVENVSFLHVSVDFTIWPWTDQNLKGRVHIIVGSWIIIAIIFIIINSVCSVSILMSLFMSC